MAPHLCVEARSPISFFLIPPHFAVGLSGHVQLRRCVLPLTDLSDFKDLISLEYAG